MMPIYPLDGGQILRSLLWFVFGRANSLLAASIIGFIGVAALIGLARVGALHLAGHHVRVHPDELLGRVDAGAGAGAYCQTAAARWLRLSGVQNRAAHRRHLAVRQMRQTIRHIRHPGHLSELRNAIQRDAMSGLRHHAPDQRMDDFADTTAIYQRVT